MSEPDQHDQTHIDLVCVYALHALPADEMSAAYARITGCTGCIRELDRFQTVVESFTFWPIDVLRPSNSMWDRLAKRISDETDDSVFESNPAPSRPEWEDVAPGISVKFLATDVDTDRVSMLVRLAPRTDYPPHKHAGLEELYLLDGVLMIDERTLVPGDYNRAEGGTIDRRVWSETGCTCLLLTSVKDELIV